ncbi:hypothetical protein TNCV_3220771 [Trichonephila clavipes]|nr:hypothetical protein TNCV_3220771 [Trichonephila clavipes]
MAKRDGGQHWGGAGQQEEAKPTRNGRIQNDKRHGRERTEAGAAKEGNKESEQNKIRRPIESFLYYCNQPILLPLLQQPLFSAKILEISPTEATKNTSDSDVIHLPYHNIQ